MTTIDDAVVTPLVVLRPASFAAATPRPRAALVVRFPGDPSVPEAALREAVLRELLRRGWQLVSAPVGEFEPSRSGHHIPLVYLTDSRQVRVDDASETLYDGPLGLADDMWGTSWLALASGTREVLVLTTAGSTPIATAADVDTAARAGHLVGLAGLLNTPQK